MIFFMAGTSDARALAEAIQQRGYHVMTSVVTDSAAKSLFEAGLSVRVGRLTMTEMCNTLTDLQATMLVDASHPFAEEAHRTAMAAAAELGMPYLRYERVVQDYATASGVMVVDTYEQAAVLAAERKGSIMLTTGSETLQIFTKRLLHDPDIRLVARMLPRLDNMEKCDSLGVEQKNIIAMQGPFSRELNIAFYKHYETTLMITKESGQVGAVDEKVQTALDLGIEVIVIGRPKIEYGTSFSTQEAILQAIEQRFNQTIERATS